MVEVAVSAVHQKLLGGQRRIQAEGHTVADVLDDLEHRFPGVRTLIADDSGEVRRFVNVYRNDEDIRFLDKLATVLEPGDTLTILPALSGGAQGILAQRERENPSPPPAPSRRFASLLEAIGNTPLVELRHLSPSPQVRLWAKLEGHNPTGSLKDRIARAMVERAEQSGELTPEHIVLEPTSGNTGISLALVGRLKGYRVKVVMPENVSPERREILEAYGAEVVLCDGSKGTNGAIEVAQEMARDPVYYMPFQYGNEANPRAHYETTGAEILRDLPEVDVFLAGLGTGGTLMGVGRRLKEHNPNVKVIAVEPHPGELVQGLRSLEDGFIPPILDLSRLDSKILVRSRDAFLGTRLLMEKEGIFAGISSGSVLHAGLRVAQRLERGNVVLLLADGGWKYLSTRLWNEPIEALEGQLDTKVWW